MIRLAVFFAVLALPGVACAQGVELEIEEPEEGLVLTVRSDGEIRTHCPPACAIELAAGEIEVTLHPRRDDERLAERVLSLTGPSRLRALHVSREGERVAGWLVLGLAALPGAAFLLAGGLWADSGGGSVPDSAVLLLALGGVLFPIGLSVGLALAFHYDEHGVELGPAPALAAD